MRVERVSHVVLDAQRLPPGDEPAADHEQGLGETEPDNDPDQHPQHALVAWADGGIDDALGQPDEPDRGRLGTDREDDRNDQRPAVRAQKADETAKCMQVWMLRAVHGYPHRRVYRRASCAFILHWCAYR